MMDEPKYEKLLFGDISAICQINRMKYVKKLLERKDLHGRLLNGSDYPLVSVPMLVLTMPFQQAKMITEEERESLNEIFQVNPLLFDFLLKRCLVGPNGEKFSDCIFMRNKDLGLFDEDLFKGTPLDIELIFDTQILPPSETWVEKQGKNIYFYLFIFIYFYLYLFFLFIYLFYLFYLFLFFIFIFFYFFYLFYFFYYLFYFYLFLTLFSFFFLAHSYAKKIKEHYGGKFIEKKIYKVAISGFSNFFTYFYFYFFYFFIFFNLQEDSLISALKKIGLRKCINCT